jgi:pheromone shutdown protein TraB
MIEFTLPPSLVISLVVAVVLPALVGLVTTRVTSGAFKGILLAVLSLATGVLTELGAALATGEAYDIGVGVLNALLALGVAQGSYASMWKPTGASEQLQRIGNDK